MAGQVVDIITAIKELMQASPTVYSGGFHLVGHSQGMLHKFINNKSLVNNKLIILIFEIKEDY